MSLFSPHTLNRVERLFLFVLVSIILFMVMLLGFKWFFFRHKVSSEIIFDFASLFFIVSGCISSGWLIKNNAVVKERNKLTNQQEQVKSIFKILQVLIPVVERKSQSSSQEIERIAKLMRRMMPHYPEERLEDWEIQLISYLLFISRIKVPDYLFVKQDKISPYEYMSIQEHCLIAQELLENNPIFARVVEAITYHHEKVDGTGYPKALQGTQIPIMARLLNIVESYVAMTTPRSYRKALTASEAIRELERNAGTTFDPGMVMIFIQEITQPLQEDRIGKTSMII